jgi:hypothetical protein
VFHILQSLPPEQRGGHIAGSYAAIAGPQGLIAVLRELAARVQVTPVELSEDQWAAYHAAAVLASNALLGLLETGRGILKDAGISPEQAGKMLIPLVEGTLKNAQEFDLPMALTGPVVRGDVGTIKRHLDVLQGDARDTYKAVMRAVIGLAERAEVRRGQTAALQLGDAQQQVRKLAIAPLDLFGRRLDRFDETLARHQLTLDARDTLLQHRERVQDRGQVLLDAFGRGRERRSGRDAVSLAAMPAEAASRETLPAVRADHRVPGTGDHR